MENSQDSVLLDFKQSFNNFLQEESIDAYLMLNNM